MHTTHHPARHIAWCTTTLALAATVTALATPATAHVPSPEVDDCSTGICGVPSSYAVGHTYSFTADYTLDNPSSMNFYDNGKCLGSITLPHSGPLAVPWVPTTPGPHEMMITENLRSPFSPPQPYFAKWTVTVQASPAGSDTPPTPGSCVSSGSADWLSSGSASLRGSS
ncbi:hypothetical protein ACFXHA_29440 [Nocardia sp. NPDC059240]|uniref:hypothetical protein n=1 Tax=Nocardia sp. NPDC059240 TaxID=3346786 RepID=UPI00369784B9